MGSRFITLILPAHNEAHHILNTLEEVTTSLSDAEIIVVDDGSTDRTASIVADFQKKFKNVRLISNKMNRGKGYSLRQGVNETSGEIVAFLDSDGDISTKECKKLIDILSSDSSLEIVVGTKRQRGSSALGSPSWLRSMVRGFGNALIQTLLLPGISDTQCGVKVFRSAAIHLLVKQTKMDRWSFDIELLALARKEGFRIKEEPVTWKETGTSHVTFFGYVKTFMDVWQIFLRLHLGGYHL